MNQARLRTGTLGLALGMLFWGGTALGAPSGPDPGAKPAGPEIPPAVQRQARALEKLLVAPCCYKGTLVDHASAVAAQMRQEIRRMLLAGKSREQILAHYRQKYGQAVLAEPPEGGLSGFILYGIPFGLAALGLLVMTVLMVRRRTASVEQEAVVLPEDHDLPAEMEARIDALIAEQGRAGPSGTEQG
jgi:cytochrome c-type biogenesis protein CcmH